MIRHNPDAYRRPHWRRLFAGVLLWWPVHASPALAASPEGVRELSIKAAFVLNIARFVQWPDTAPSSAADRFWLCTLQDDVFREAGEGIRGRSVGGRPLGLRIAPSVGETAGCNILFIPGGRLAAYLAETANRPIPNVLTVTDLTDGDPGEAERPQPIVALFRDQSRIRFSIDIGLSQRSGLRLSSELLKLGRIVGGEGSP